MNTTIINETPKAWVGCLASYNNGHLFGKWIDLTQEMSDIEHDIDVMLNESPMDNAEEFEVFDTEYVYASGVGTCIETAKAHADFFIEHGELGIEVLKYLDDDLESAESAMDGQYCGEADSEQAYTEQTFDDCYDDVPSYLAGYIDFETMTRDWFRHGSLYSITVKGQCHIFDSEM